MPSKLSPTGTSKLSSCVSELTILVRAALVVLCKKLYIKELEHEICIFTTHLKARRGLINSKLRHQQSNNLLKFMQQMAGNELPIILCGDFNAEPSEAAYSTILTYEHRELGSAYADFNMKQKHVSSSSTTEIVSMSRMHEPRCTTWKRRDSGEECHTLDYIFYSKECLKVVNCLQFPAKEDNGEALTPSMQYPSDHFSLLCDFEIAKPIPNYA